MELKYVYSISKLIIDLRLFALIYFAIIKKYGIIKATKEIKKYLHSQKNVFRATPNRYVKQGSNYIVLPDVPPLNSKDFIHYILEDIEVVNHRKAEPLVFAILCISSRCPYKCVYCYNSDSHQQTEIIPLEILEKTIFGLIEKGIKNIHLSGGEPMMRYNDLVKILKKFNNQGIGFWLLTTGWNLDKEKLIELQNNGLRGLLLSLDSNEKDWVKEVKGSYKAYYDAINVIKEATELGLIVTIDSVINRNLLSQDKFENYVKFIGSLGAKFINCYAPRQIREHNVPNLKAFSIKELKKLEELTLLTQKSKDYYHLPVANTPDKWESIRGCMGGKMFIYIDPEGNVKACPFLPKPLGNIFKSDIQTIIMEIKNRKISIGCSPNQLLTHHH
ncbi:MAG: radical SAM protein [Leptospiraceae bacterium]|nr:radical SAM protein [Leptospiraceae bacterium]MCP5493363.1 radical SAM protein [Leptospiraceae bacterium]